LNCFETILPECKSQDQVDKVKRNFLDLKLDLARNNSYLFGDPFIASCPELAQRERDILLEVFGSNRCSFSEALKIIDIRSNCSDEAVETFKNKLEFVRSFVSGNGQLT
jgi:hypothetical protein